MVWSPETNIKGPKGDKGDQGDQGTPGADGITEEYADTRYVNVTGDIMTGKLTMMASSTAGAGLTITPGPGPSSPVPGDFYINGDLAAYRGTANTRVLLNDGNNQTVGGVKTFSGIVTGNVAVKAYAATAIPAGGTAGAGFTLSSATNFGVFFGSGAPTLSAAQGSIYLRSDGVAGSRSYVNTNGTTGWEALAGAVDLAGKEPTIAAGTAAQYWQGTKTWQTLDKAAVGLANVDNTSDANKPVSTDQAAALALKANIVGQIFTGRIVVPASIAGSAYLNIGNGANVTSPVDGDMWMTTSNFLYRLNGTSRFVANLDQGQIFTAGKSFNLSTVFMAGTATPAGGATTANIKFGTAGIGIYFGSGAPTLTAVQGSIYLRSDGAAGARTYVNTNGTTGWEALGAAGGASVVISDTAPSSPTVGTLWYESDSGNTFIWYTDADSSQWVQVNVSNATAALGTAATKNMHVGTTAPSSPAVNDVWIDTT